MKPLKYISLIAFGIVCQPGNAQKTTPLPRVFATEARLLAETKKLLTENDRGLLQDYNGLLTEADKALQFGAVSVMEKTLTPPSGDKHDYMSLAPYYWPDPSKPDGLPYIRKDGETNPEVKDFKDKEYLPQLCDKVYKLSLAYYFSGNAKYARHAAQLLRVWFLDAGTKMNPNLNYGQAIKGENSGRGAGMIDVRHFLKVIDGMGLLSGSADWTLADQQGMVEWYTRFLNWMQSSRIGISEMNAPNNHGMWYDALRLSITLFIDDKRSAKEVILNAENRLDKQMDEEGEFPLELQRTISLHYSVFVLNALFNIAQMGEQLEVDMWHFKTLSGKSIRKGFDAIYPYLAKQKKWPGKQIKEFSFEEGFRLLKTGYRKLNCKNCLTDIQKITANSNSNPLINLTY